MGILSIKRAILSSYPTSIHTEMVQRASKGDGVKPFLSKKEKRKIKTV
jgi:hypothetical protein